MEAIPNEKITSLSAHPQAGAAEPGLAAAAPVAAGHPPSVCAACGSPLLGVYCHYCGQKALDTSHFTVRHLVGEFVREVTSFDGKLWSTARLLVTRPGQLVVDYLQGRGQLHVSPVKLYLVSTAIYFLLFPYAILNVPDMEQFASQIRDPAVEPFFTRMRSSMESGAFYSSYQNWYTLLLACTVAINTLVLKTVFRNRVTGEHLVFALNELTFVFLLVLPLAVIRLFTTGWEAIGGIATIALILAWVAYVTLSIRRVYGPSRRKLVLFMTCYLLFRQMLDSALALAAIFLATS